MILTVMWTEKTIVECMGDSKHSISAIGDEKLHNGFVIVFSFLLVSIHLVDMSEYLEVPKKCITLSCYLFVCVCV